MNIQAVEFVKQRYDSKTDFSKQNQVLIGISECYIDDLQIGKVVRIQCHDESLKHYQIFHTEKRIIPPIAFIKEVETNPCNPQNFWPINVKFPQPCES